MGALEVQFIFFSHCLNDLAKYLTKSCGSGIYISDTVQQYNLLMLADEVSRFADTVCPVTEADQNYIGIFFSGWSKI